MANHKLQFFILTGEPGIGKTTLTKKLSTAIAGKGVKVSGFYTEEIRKAGVREGFDIVTLDGRKGRLARDQRLLNPPIIQKVGKYGVLVKEFETIALPSMVKPQDSHPHVLVIDEIGKMELFSKEFKTAIGTIFSDKSNHTVLATIPIRRVDPLIDNIRNHRHAREWMVTRANRDSIHEEILMEITAALMFE